MFMLELLETKPNCLHNPFGTTHCFHDTTRNYPLTPIKEDHYIGQKQCCWCGIEGKEPHGFKITHGVELPKKG
jgi:hypothetical protein